jgi:hypothetical protein
VAEREAAGQEHLGEVAQAELVAKPPEHHEGDHVGGVLGPVQHGAGALVGLLAAAPAAEPATALSRPPRALARGSVLTHTADTASVPFVPKRGNLPIEAIAGQSWREC